MSITNDTISNLRNLVFEKSELATALHIDVLELDAQILELWDDNATLTTIVNTYEQQINDLLPKLMESVPVRGRVGVVDSWLPQGVEIVAQIDKGLALFTHSVVFNSASAVRDLNEMRTRIELVTSKLNEIRNDSNR